MHSKIRFQWNGRVVDAELTDALAWQSDDNSASEMLEARFGFTAKDYKPQLGFPGYVQVDRAVKTLRGELIEQRPLPDPDPNVVY